MPELPEVETTRRGLQAAIVGQRIVGVEVRRADLRQPIPADFAKKLTACTIIAVARRAKYLLIRLDSGDSILAHLGMSGSFTVTSQTGYCPKTHDHVIISFENSTLVVFHDPRRFGLLLLLPTAEEACHKLLKNLGPEPLESDFSAAYLRAQLALRHGAIKPVLMDQKLVVGVGNIYASEALHFCGIHPSQPAYSLIRKTPEIVAAVQATLQAAIASGGSTLRDYVGASGGGGYFQHEFRVYGRDGEPCFRCATFIETCTHAGRSTYWCPQCQRLRKTAPKT